MARYNDLEWTPEVLKAAEIWRDRCFYNDGSLFSDEKLWTLENIQELYNYTKDFEVDKGKSYWQKLEEHLENAPQQVIALDAQIHCFLYLFPLGKTLPTAKSNITSKKKHENINKILSWADITLPQNILHGLLTDELLGVGSSGSEFIKQLYLPHKYLLSLLVAFKSITPNQKSQFNVSDDSQAAWKFAEWLDDLPDTRNTMMQNALLFFLYPDYFERIISSDHKNKIVKYFKIFLPNISTGQLSKLSEIDKAIYEIRQKLELTYPNDIVDFYIKPIQVGGHWIDADVAFEKFKDAGQAPILPNTNKQPLPNEAVGTKDDTKPQSVDSDALRSEELEEKEHSKRTEVEQKLVTHYVRERVPKLRKAKLGAMIKKYGHLKCECCDTIGDAYMPEIRRSIFEVHHKKPLSKGLTINGLDDLALLCANCHRAIHATNPLLSLEEFKNSIT